jgi:hypothetical protein
MNCTVAGTRLDTLELEEGYWRPSVSSVDIRTCPKDDLCTGGVKVRRARSEEQGARSKE